MPVFEYCGFSNSGEDTSGCLIADNPRSARDQLRREGVIVDSLRVAKAQSKSRSFLAGLGSADVRWAETAYELSTLLAAGVPLLSALDTVAEQSKRILHRTLLQVRDRVAAGASLADAMAEHPSVFDALSIRLVEVGQNSGNLEQSLDRLATFKLRWHQLRDQVIGALVYPLFVLTFGTAATIFLMTYVMPPLLENLQETLSELPWPTQIVKAGSDLLLHHGLLLVVFVCSSILACGALLRSSLGRFYVDRLWLRLPILGPLTTKQNVSRIALILSTLLESGITLADALELAAKSTRNRVLKRALESCRESLLAGGNLAVSLHHSGVIPPLAIQVITVGQESGRLDELLARLAADYDRQVASASGRLASTLEPALILLLAAMVGFVLLAIVLPILEAGNVAM